MNDSFRMTKMKTTILKLFVGATFLVAQGCGETQVKELGDVTQDEKLVAEKLQAIGGRLSHENDDDDNEIVTIDFANSQNATDAWLKEHTEEIKKVENLKFINLMGTPATKKGIEALEKALPGVEVQSNFSKKK